MTTFRNQNDAEQNITFLTFLNVMTWAENADREKKVRGMSSVFNKI